MRVRRLVLGAALTMSVAAAGCSGGGKDKAADPDPSGIRGLLAMIPASGDSRTSQITVDLYAQAAKSGNIDRPGHDAGSQALGTYAGNLSREPVFAAGSDLFTELATYGAKSRQLNGFDVADLDADIDLGDPPRALVAARGRFDTAVVEHALRNEPAWKSALQVQKKDGATVLHWLPDNQINLNKVRTGAFTMLGKSRRIAVTGEKTLLYSPTDAGIGGLLDTTAKQGRSLDDLGAYAATGAALDEKSVYSAILTHGPRGTGTLPPYDLLAVGVARSSVVVVVAAKNAGAAKSVSAALTSAMRDGTARDGEKWADLAGTPKITTDGRVTVMTVTSGKVRPIWRQLPEDPVFTASS